MYGYTVKIPEKEQAVLQFISDLPPDAMIAGWYEMADVIPYVTGKRILLSYETHVAFHENYVLEMRRRMNALINAYFANDIKPIEELRNFFGVTHLLVDKTHYVKNAPNYFQPFKDKIAVAVTSLNPIPETIRQMEWASVFENEKYFLLDLKKIVSTTKR